MFERFTKEYLPTTDLIAHLMGWGLLLVFFSTMGFLLLKYHYHGKIKGAVIYKPLGWCFIALSALSAIMVISVRINYLWVFRLISVLCLVSGILGFWCWVSIPEAIKQRQQIRDCDSLREDYEKLKEEIKVQQGVIDNLIKHKDVPNPSTS